MAGKNVDVQGFVEDWAMEYFRRKANKKEKKLLENDYISMEIDWKRVRFTHAEPKYEPEPPKPGAGTPINNILFTTHFTNKTGQPQRYTFKTERTTRSSCSVGLESSYTTGVEMSVKLATPCSILEANAGYKRELCLTSTSGETIEEELTWGVDSEIEVKGRHRAEAQLIIVEEEYSGKFSIKTSISGRVRAVFTNVKDNNSFVRAVEGDVDEIISRCMGDGKLHGDAIVVDKATRSVVCKTGGTCRFKYGIKQNVEVDQKPIDDWVMVGAKLYKHKVDLIVISKIVPTWSICVLI